MIPTPQPPQAAVIAIDIRQTERTARPVSGAVHNNQRNPSHTLNRRQAALNKQRTRNRRQHRDHHIDPLLDRLFRY